MVSEQNLLNKAFEAQTKYFDPNPRFKTITMQKVQTGKQLAQSLRDCEGVKLSLDSRPENERARSIALKALESLARFDNYPRLQIERKKPLEMLKLTFGLDNMIDHLESEKLAMYFGIYEAYNPVHRFDPEDGDHTWANSMTQDEIDAHPERFDGFAWRQMLRIAVLKGGDRYYSFVVDTDEGEILG